MKKQLLLVALMITGKAFSQSFTQANEASVGSSVSMYICDSLTTNNASTKGSNAVWDFTNLLIPDTVKRSLISVIDPATTQYKSYYSTSNKAIVFENFLTSYYSSTANERNCLGYYFSSTELGDVKAVFNTNPEVTHSYPFALNSVKNDQMTGTLYYNYSSIPVTAVATGSSMTEVDALGTLKIDAAQIFNNVLRYHIKDSVNATVTLQILGTVNATLKRDQYEYYDLSVSNLPIYTHSNLKAFVYKISSDPLVDKTTVLSKYKGDKNAKPVDPTSSITGVKLTNYAIYPNPAKDLLYVIGENVSNATISIIEQSGKVLNTFNQTNVLSISSLEKGVYFVQISGLNNIEVLKFIKE